MRVIGDVETLRLIERGFSKLVDHHRDDHHDAEHPQERDVDVAVAWGALVQMRIQAEGAAKA